MGNRKIEIIDLFTVRCFCVIQKQKGVADAMIETHLGTNDTAPWEVSCRFHTRFPAALWTSVLDFTDFVGEQEGCGFRFVHIPYDND